MTADNSKPRPVRYRWWIALVAVVAAIVLLTVSLTVFRKDSPEKQLSNGGDSPNDPDVIIVDEEEEEPIVMDDPKEDPEDTDERDNKRPDDGTMTKTEWPELVGEDGDIAKQTIEKENPSLVEVDVLPQGSMVTTDYREDRVWIYVDSNNKVVKTPRVG